MKYLLSVVPLVMQALVARHLEPHCGKDLAEAGSKLLNFAQFTKTFPIGTDNVTQGTRDEGHARQKFSTHSLFGSLWMNSGLVHGDMGDTGLLPV